MKRLTRFAAVAALTAGLGASCGGGDGATKRFTNLTTAGWVVCDSSNKCMAGPVTAVPGDPIVFTNDAKTGQDAAEVVATSPGNAFPPSGILKRGQAYEWKVPKDIPYDKIDFEDDLHPDVAGSHIDIVRQPPKM